MLKFNNYPPHELSDIELTVGAEAAIKQSVDLTHHEFEDVRASAHLTLHSFGRAIGHTLLGASIGDRFTEFAEPFASQHLEVRAGLLTALTEVRKLEEEGVAYV
jgi:hypothetical protein